MKRMVYWYASDYWVFPSPMQYDKKYLSEKGYIFVCESEVELPDINEQELIGQVKQNQHVIEIQKAKAVLGIAS